MTGPTRLRKLFAALCGGLAMTWIGSLAFSPDVSAKSVPQTDQEKTIYFLGVLTSRQARELGLSSSEAELMIQGLRDALDGKAIELDQAEYFPKLQTLAKERHAVVLEKEKNDSKLFLEKASQTKGATTTESGLIITEIKAGSGPSPGPTDVVKVHYHGTLRDGTVFDSSVQRGEPTEFPLNRVIPCWTEGVGMMKVGGKAKLVCPPEIAYGDRGAPPSIPGGAALTFEVELIEIVGQ
jgi:FKBP-type peptidyl-prolyl cis-trans isomerase FkpA